jgi:hemolysin D
MQSAFGVHHLSAIVELAVTTIGERVVSCAPLMTLVPARQALVVEALVPNKDVRFVKIDDCAAIKLEAFPFTRYGLLEGKVNRVAADAVTVDRRGLVFSSLDCAWRIRVLRKATNTQRPLTLSPGMAASVEIRAGQRRVIDFVLSPIAKATSEAGRER